MKKIMTLVFMLVTCLCLYACGEKQEQIPVTNGDVETVHADGTYTVDDLIGVWHSEKSQQVLLINSDMSSRYNFGPNSSGMDNPDYQMEINGDTVPSQFTKHTMQPNK